MGRWAVHAIVFLLTGVLTTSVLLLFFSCTTSLVVPRCICIFIPPSFEATSKERAQAESGRDHKKVTIEDEKRRRDFRSDISDSPCRHMPCPLPSVEHIEICVEKGTKLEKDNRNQDSKSDIPSFLPASDVKPPDRVVMRRMRQERERDGTPER